MENQNVVAVAQMVRQKLGADAASRMDAIARANAAEGDLEAASFWENVAQIIRRAEH